MKERTSDSLFFFYFIQKFYKRGRKNVEQESPIRKRKEDHCSGVALKKKKIVDGIVLPSWTVELNVVGTLGLIKEKYETKQKIGAVGNGMQPQRFVFPLIVDCFVNF